MSATSCDGPDGNAAYVDVRTGDLSVGRWIVQSGPPADYHLDLSLKGPERVDFFFTNDYANHACDRNLTLHSVEFKRVD
jgi:hypothetical protein